VIVTGFVTAWITKTQVPSFAKLLPPTAGVVGVYDVPTWAADTEVKAVSTIVVVSD
jgi:hypothetical protein